MLARVEVPKMVILFDPSIDFSGVSIWVVKKPTSCTRILEQYDVGLLVLI